MRLVSARMLALLLVCGSLVISAIPAASQETAKKPAVKQARAPQTPPNSGPVMFREYCAACHGPGGTGNGPAATALKTLPANLTLLSKKNGGTFPQKHVEDVLKYGIQTAAHGSSDMPVWGPTFRALSSGNDVVALRIANLVDYLRALQAQ